MSTDKKTLSVEVKLTNRCNQECVHCVNRDGLESVGRLDCGLFLARLEEWAAERDRSVAALREVRMTGGEPLLEFDSVLAVARACRRLGIGSGINTNGLLLDPDRLRDLKEAGVGLLKISFDSVEEDIYNSLRGGLESISSLRDSIALAVGLGFRVILRFTLFRTNRDQLVPCWKSAGGLGTHLFQVKPLVAAGRALEEEGFPPPPLVREALAALSEVAAGAAPPVEVLCWPPEPGSPLRYKICGNIDKIYVSTSLDVSICNYIEGGRDVPLGDLRRESLEEILRRRLSVEWTERVNGFALATRCPNAALFRAAGRLRP